MVIIAYDISKNRTRNLMVKFLRTLGLYRIQNSVFIGDVNWKLLKSSIKKLDILINPETDIVSCYYIEKDHFSNGITIGNFKDDYFIAIEDFSIF